MSVGLKRIVLIVAAGVLVLISVVGIRATVEGKDCLKRGDALHAENQDLKALRLWRQAARWYVPLASHVESAYQRMEKLADDARQSQNVDLELASLRGIRSSIWATRSILYPNVERLKPVNLRIADIMAKSEDPNLDPARSESERAAWHYELLAKDTAPKRSFTLLAGLGFVIWVGSVFGFAIRGVGDDDHLRPKAAIYSGVFFVVGFVVWLGGLYAA